MNDWTPDIDPATIPSDVIWSEVGRRRQDARSIFHGGRPKKLTECRCCGELFGVREKRGHFKRCPARKAGTE